MKERAVIARAGVSAQKKTSVCAANSVSRLLIKALKDIAIAIFTIKKNNKNAGVILQEKQSLPAFLYYFLYFLIFCAKARNNLSR